MRKCTFTRKLNQLVADEASNQAARQHLKLASTPRRRSIKTMLANEKLRQHRTPEGHEVRLVKYTRSAWDGRKLARMLTKAQLKRCRKLEHGERLDVRPAVKAFARKSA